MEKEFAELIQKVREEVLGMQDRILDAGGGKWGDDALSALDSLSALCDSPTGQGGEAEALRLVIADGIATAKKLENREVGHLALTLWAFNAEALLSSRRPAPVKSEVDDKVYSAPCADCGNSQRHSPGCQVMRERLKHFPAPVKEVPIEMLGEVSLIALRTRTSLTFQALGIVITPPEEGGSWEKAVLSDLDLDACRAIARRYGYAVTEKGA